MASFKEFEHDGWQMVADKYHEYFEQLTRQTIPSLMEPIEKGNKVIDVACGPGYVADAIRQKGATAIGVDFSDAMVQRATKSFPEIKFVEGDAENLEHFEDSEFSHLTMNFGLLHLERPEKALSEAYRVIQKNGTAAFTVWAPPDRSAGFRCILDNINKFASDDVVLPQGPAFFRFSDKYEFQNRLIDAGFEEEQIHFKHIDMLWKLPDGEAFFNAFFQGTPRTGGTLRAQSKKTLKSIKNGVLESCKKFQTGNSLEIPMVSLLALGKK